MSSDPERGPPRWPSGVPQPSEIPILSDVHATWSRFTDPAAKLERRKRRTSRALTLWVVLTMISVLFAVTGYAGLLTGAEGVQGAFGGLLGMITFGALGVRSGRKLRTLRRTEIPASASPPRLPPTGSRAREPMRRLAQSEASLTELLDQLAQPAGSGSSGVAEISVEHVRSTADEASAALRDLAARIQAIERAGDNISAEERRALDSAVHSLGEQLDDGLAGYGTLVAAAGRAVAASSTGVEPAKETLTDATDHLAGLAAALRELSEPGAS